MVMHSLLAHLDQRWFIIWLVKKKEQSMQLKLQKI